MDPHTPSARRTRIQGLLAAASGALLLLVAAGPGSLAGAPAAAQDWHQITDLSAAGWSPEVLAEARALAEELRSGAVFVVHRGRVVVAWGDIERPFKMASLRKSVVSALFGIHVASGAIDLDETLEQIGIDDLAPLSSAERLATVRHLLSARSGVYHPAAYEPAGMKRRRPPRGSAAAGEQWLYNNWDFNALGTIFERRVGRGLFAEFADELAQPLGMQDFNELHGIEFLEPSTSRHAAHLFRLSARDLARFGQLYLDGGVWQGRRVVPASWVAESTRIHSPLAAGNPYGAGGYGYLWWIYPANDAPEREVDRFDAVVGRGNGGQVLALLPSEGLVLVHCGDWYHDRSVSYADVARIFDTILRARGAAGADEPSLGPLRAEPFEHSLPAPRLRHATELPPATLERLTGEYRMAPDTGFSVWLHEGRLFARPVGLPLAEIELLAESPRHLFSNVFPLDVSVDWQDDLPRQIRIRMGPREMVATRSGDG